MTAKAASNPRAVLLGNFLGSLQKLMRLGGYYQKGHKLIEAAAEAFRRDLHLLAQEHAEIHFTLAGGQLLLENDAITTENNFVRDFKRLLDDLGVIELTISRQVRPVEVQDFFQNLQATHLRLRSTHGFASVPELENIPASIKVVRKRYVDGEVSGAGGDAGSQGEQATFAMLIDRLRAKGLSEVRLERCHSILKALSLRFKDQQRQLASKNLPYISWEDVERLLVRVSTAQVPMFAEEQPSQYPDSIADLAAILGSLEIDAQQNQSRNAIDLMLLQIKRLYDSVSVEPHPAELVSRQDDSQNVQSLKSLNTFLDEHPFRDELQQEIKRRSHQENLSILMQLMKKEHPADVQQAIDLHFQELFVSSPVTSEWQILLGGFTDILDEAPLTQIAIAAKNILYALRLGENPFNLLFLRDILTVCDETRLEKIWPYAVNEVIQFAKPDSEVIINQILAGLAKLPSLIQERWLPCLENLDGFTGKKVALELFAIAKPASYPLLAQLTRTSLRGLIFERAFTGLVQKPPDWILLAVAPFLDRNKTLHQEFMRAYLRHGRINSPSRVLIAMTGSILVESLRALGEEQRKEPHVAAAIRILHIFKNPEVESLLQEIGQGKKMLFLRSWPASCRQAAQEALQQMTGKGRAPYGH